MSEKMKLGEICNFINGRAFKPSEWDKKGLPIVRIQNLNDENAEFNFCSKAIEDKYIIEDNQLLFSWSGTPGTSFGAFFWNRGKAVLNQHIFKVIPKININIEFLRYLLNGNLDIIISKSHGGVGLQHITKRELEEIIVDIPDDKRQEYVAKTLNGITKIINTRKEQLKQFDEIIKSQFVEMFGNPILNNKNWSLYKWNDVLTIKNGKNQKKVEKQDGKYPIYGSGGIMSYATDYICNEDTVIIGRKGNINNPILVRTKFWNVDTAFGLEPNKDKLLVEYLYYFCNFYNFEKHNKAVTIPSLTKSDLLNIDIPIPDIELQNQFAEIVKQIDKQKFEIENSLKEMQELYESLMERYFG